MRQTSNVKKSYGLEEEEEGGRSKKARLGSDCVV